MNHKSRKQEVQWLFVAEWQAHRHPKSYGDDTELIWIPTRLIWWLSDFLWFWAMLAKTRVVLMCARPKIPQELLSRRFIFMWLVSGVQLRERNNHLSPRFCPSVPPRIIEEGNKTSVLVVREGEEFSIPCVAEGSPSPNVGWIKDDNPVHPYASGFHKNFYLI